VIDTHSHLYLDAFDDDLDAVLDRAREAGVAEIIMPAIDLNSIEQALKLCEKHPNLYAMVALHPSETKEATDADFETVASYTSHPRVVAIGETGLDYYWDTSFVDRQEYFLRKHIQLAVESDLPIVFHNRDATDDLIRILSEEKECTPDPSRLRGIFHCFGGPASAVEAILGLGFFVGLGGTLTFKNGGVPDAITGIPLTSIVLETDAPFLAPVPYRGKRNEPAHILRVAEKLALLRSVDLDVIVRETSVNARRLFGLEA